MINILLALGVVLGVLLVPGRSVDPEIQPYYDHATKIIDEHCKFYQRSFFGYESFTFTDKMENDNVAAYCRKRPFGFQIVMNRNGWDLMSESDKTSVFLHEVGHCFLGLQHSDNPKDIMYWSLVSLPQSMVEGQFVNYVIKACE